jgi:hypothetical protein
MLPSLDFRIVGEGNLGCLYMVLVEYNGERAWVGIES